MGSRSRSLRSYLFLMMGIVIIAVAVASLLLYFLWSRELRANTAHLLNDAADRTEEALNRNLYSVNTLALLTISDPEVQEVLVAADGASQQRLADTLRLENTVRHRLVFDEAWHDRLIDSVFIFLAEDHYASVLRGMPTSGTYRRAQECYRQALASERAVTLSLPRAPGESFYLSFIISEINLNRRIGVCVLELSPEVFAPVSELAGSYPGTVSEVYAGDGHPYFTVGGWADEQAMHLLLSDGRALRQQQLHGQRYLAFIRPLSYYGFSLASALPAGEAYRDLNRALLSYSAITILLVLSLMLVAWVTVRRITRHIEAHMEAVIQVGKGDFSTTTTRSGIREFDRLGMVFADMVQQIDTLIHEVYEKKVLQVQMELKSLQAQVNPHFLFNVLERIGWEAKRANDEVVYDMVVSLGELMHAGLYTDGTETIPLSEEFEYVQFYLNLQQARFGDRLAYRAEVDESLLGLRVPKLSVECLVENAVVHGLEQKRGGGTLEVRVRQEGEIACLTVRDNGAGFDASAFDLNDPDGRAPHIGLRNTHRRIRLLYGEAYGLALSSVPGEGTTVTMRLPADRRMG